MKKGILKSINYALIGIGIGTLISLCFTLSYKINYQPSSNEFMNLFHNTGNAMLISVILWALLGVISYWMILILRIQNWSILKKTILHAIMTYILVLFVAFLSKWFTFNLPSLSLFTIIFILIYVLEWIIHSKNIKKEINQINKSLKK